MGDKHMWAYQCRNCNEWFKSTSKRSVRSAKLRASAKFQKHLIYCRISLHYHPTPESEAAE